MRQAEPNDSVIWDLIIIGAGPTGITCSVAAQRAGLSALMIDKGALLNSIIGYPTNLEFFSTPELLEIPGIPFNTANYKPRRAEALEYYRNVVRVLELPFRLYERVLAVEGRDGHFAVVTEKRRYRCCKVIVSVGFFDIPALLEAPGEDLPKVRHYYREPYPYVGQRVAVIGAANSAAQAALDTYRHGAEVTLVVREGEISRSVKYWIRPDLENRIKEGAIQAFFNTTVERITEEKLHLNTPAGPVAIDNDWVLAMTGYRPDFDFLRQLGLELGEDPHCTPVYRPDTMETSRPGVYMAGVVCGGLNTGRWFIENSFEHADKIMTHITAGTEGRGPRDEFDDSVAGPRSRPPGGT